METVRRSNGIIIRNFPAFQSMTTDYRQALEKALVQLHQYHPRLRADGWSLSDTLLPRNCPDEVRITSRPELLRVVAGAGLIISDGLTDGLDYGYWVFVPKQVTYSLRGTIISGMNFRVVTLPLK